MNTTPVSHGDVTVIAIGGKRLVSGLYWQTLSQPRKVMKEAREIGRRDAMDIVAIRRLPTIIQAGFMRRQRDAQKGMYSLASVVADLLLPKLSTSPLDPLVAAFAVGDGRYAIVAFKDGGVVPDSDLVVQDIGTAQRALRTFYSLLGSKGKTVSVYAPLELEFGGDASVTLEDLARAAQRAHKLKPLRFGLSTREWLLVLGFIIVGASALMAYHEWRAREQERLALLERQRAAELDRVRRESGQTLPDVVQLRPWTVTPNVGEMLGHCNSAEQAAPLFVGAWQFIGIRCTTAGYTVAYERLAGGSVTEFREAASRTFPGATKTAFQEGADRATVEIESQPPAAGDDPKGEITSRVDTLVAHMQHRLVLITVTPKPAKEPGQPGLVAAPGPNEPDWKTATFEITTAWQPTSIFEGLDTQGIRVLEVSTTLKERALSYVIKGEIYGQ